MFGTTTQKQYRKRMVEIWEECAKFKTTSQILADQARPIIKNGWFSDFEILEMHLQNITESCQQDPNTRNKTVNSEK